MVGWRKGFKVAVVRDATALTLSTAPRLLISNVDQSPFNVATRIELSDLGLDQVMHLAALHRLSWSTEQCRANWTAWGPPAALRLAFYRLSRKSTPVARLTAPHEPRCLSAICPSPCRSAAGLPALQKTFSGDPALRSVATSISMRSTASAHAGLLLEEPYSGDWRFAIPYRYLGAAFGLALHAHDCRDSAGHHGFRTTGALRDDAPYVEDRRIPSCSPALQEGEFCSVLAPRQIGRSSLRVRCGAPTAQKRVSPILRLT